MTKKSIDPFDQFYCMSAHDSDMAYAVREIYKTYGDKTCVGRKSLHKFGENRTVGTTQEPINTWGQPEEYQASNVTLNMSSSDASDTAVVTIEYMAFDANNDMQFGIQTKTLSGQTPVALDTAGCRWTRISTSTNVNGDVYLYRGTATNGVPDDATKIHNQISVGFNQSQKSATSIAAGNYFLLTNIWGDILKKTGASAEIILRIRNQGEDFRVRLRRGVDTSHSLSYQFKPLEIIEPNSDIEVYAEALSGADNNISVGFDGYFADIISS